MNTSTCLLVIAASDIDIHYTMNRSLVHSPDGVRDGEANSALCSASEL